MNAQAIPPISGLLYFLVTVAGGLAGLLATGSYWPWLVWGVGLLVGYALGMGTAMMVTSAVDAEMRP